MARATATRDVDKLPILASWHVRGMLQAVTTRLAELAVQPRVIKAALKSRVSHKAGVAGTVAVVGEAVVEALRFIGHDRLRGSGLAGAAAVLHGQQFLENADHAALSISACPHHESYCRASSNSLPRRAATPPLSTWGLLCLPRRI